MNLNLIKCIVRLIIQFSMRLSFWVYILILKWLSLYCIYWIIKAEHILTNESRKKNPLFFISYLYNFQTEQLAISFIFIFWLILYLNISFQTVDLRYRDIANFSNSRLTTHCRRILPDAEWQRTQKRQQFVLITASTDF